MLSSAGLENPEAAGSGFSARRPVAGIVIARRGARAQGIVAAMGSRFVSCRCAANGSWHSRQLSHQGKQEGAQARCALVDGRPDTRDEDGNGIMDVCPCFGDLDHDLGEDGGVDLADLTALLAQYETICPQCVPARRAPGLAADSRFGGSEAGTPSMAMTVGQRRARAGGRIGPPRPGNVLRQLGQWPQA